MGSWVTCQLPASYTLSFSTQGQDGTDFFHVGCNQRHTGCLERQIHSLRSRMQFTGSSARIFIRICWHLLPNTYLTLFVARHCSSAITCTVVSAADLQCLHVSSDCLPIVFRYEISSRIVGLNCLVPLHRGMPNLILQCTPLKWRTRRTLRNGTS